jgi:hypothetical protein
MIDPSEQLNNTEVILFTPIDGRHKPTGDCRHIVGGDLLGAAAGLAICRYESDSSFYLFYCDEHWGVLTDTWHETIEDAKAQAEFEYKGTSRTWQAVS